MKHESLKHFIVIGREHFDYIVSLYVAYYHGCRPHQGIGNVLLPKTGEKPNDLIEDDAAVDTLPLDLDEIRCEARFGGLLRHYYREAS